MPARHSMHDQSTSMIDDLDTSPHLEFESAELERELGNAEQHLDRGVTLATEESDADTVSTNNFYDAFVCDTEREKLLEYSVSGWRSYRFYKIQAVTHFLKRDIEK